MTTHPHHRRRAGGGDAAETLRIVSLAMGDLVREILLVSGMTTREVSMCIAAGFAHGGRAVAVRHATQRVVYPLSLLAQTPQRFTDGMYEVIFSEEGNDEDEDVMDETAAKTVGREAVHHAKRKGRGGRARRGHHHHHHHHHHDRHEDDPIGLPEFVDTYGDLSPSSLLVAETEDGGNSATDVDPALPRPYHDAHDDDDDDDDEEEEEEEDELLRELDLTDFELPQLVHVFAQACPTGQLNRATFERCLDKILSQSGRYDPLAHKMFTRLFDIFDRNHTNSIDVAEFLGGVSVFASGERDEKIRFTFDLYDTDSDGYISIDEMTKYLTAVFIVIAETSPELFQQNQINPRELGVVTAQQCFKEAPLNEDGLLSFEAFQQWYSMPGPTQFVANAGRPVTTAAENGKNVGEFTLERLRDVTGLATLSVDDLFSIFGTAAGEDPNDNFLTREQFKKCFFTILKKQKKKPTRDIARFLDQLFNAFDTDGSDTVDFVELSSGLSILCGGSRDEKVVAAFSLFDSDGDGYITRDEMEKYLSSVFNVMYETNPATKHTMAIDPATLARYTTAQAFADADLNHDGRLSLDEFRKWYTGGGAAIVSRPQPPHPPYAPHAPISIADNALASIEFVASLTSLRDRKPAEVFEILAGKVNEDGVLSRDAFHEIFEELVAEQTAKTKRALSQSEITKLHSILNTVFDAFDTDNDGFVDFCELSSGISVFCDGSQHEKVKAAFTLFDVNQDGYISREEMETYLASVYRIIFTTSPATAQQMGNITPEELAHVTTTEAFATSDVNHDGRLSFDEFTKWYTQQQLLPHHASPAAVPALSQSAGSILGSSRGALKEMKELTNLGSYDVNDIFEFFAASADAQGNVSKPSFFRCFHKLLAEKNGTLTPELQTRARQLLVELFELFDTDQNGVIDVQELGAGLSILCGGSLTDKAKSLFTLYDLNHDGFISPAEMNSYLTAVFKVLYKASPNLQAQTGLTPQQLALATSQECFQAYDHNHDNKLSFDEFREWIETQKAAGKSVLGASLQQKPVLSGALPKSDVAAASSPFADVIPVDVAKKLTGLNGMSLEKVAEIFSSAANANGLISRKAFDNCFYKYLVSNASSELTAQESTRVHEVIDRLFTAFDNDANGFVDLNDLSSGLSILCGGNRDAKVRAAFNLYDTNGDGLISEEEMVHYLTSVFKLLYALDPTREQNLGITADDLAIITSAEIFADADTDHDGKLNFEEFKRWYVQPQQESFNAIVAPLDLDEVRRLTNLGNLDVVDVFERFAEHADEEGLLHRQAFDECFEEIIETASHPRTDVEKLRAKVVAERLFDVFDRDHNGKIDFSELASGLSVLCKGARDAKVKAAFRLYDFNGDGFISLDEMTRYLTSIFKVLYEVQPQMKEETGVTAEELGTITAEQAFLEADQNRDGKLNYDEFLTWYNSPSQAGISSVVAKNAVVDSSLRWMPLAEIKDVTNLARYEPEEVFEIFAAEANKDGLLSRAAFNSSFRKIMEGIEGGTATKKSAIGAVERAKIKEVIDGLFDLFDSDRSGYVDFGELASGLSVLCGGSKEQKVRAAFALFDFNGDGFISLDEMIRYLTSVFRVLFQVSADTQHLGVTPEELGEVTAQQAFAEADHDHDGRLTFEEFQEWYQQPGGIGEVAKDGEQLFSLAEARRLTNLSAFSPIEVFEALAECADEQGYVTKEAFDKCFRKFISESDRGMKPEEFEHVTAILNRLFDLFDVDKNGVVDFSEISSGVSVFCGGSSDEKVRAAFSLYDYNGDGFISFDEMERYLTAVFKVLKEASPQTLSRLDESAEDLGKRTARQAFEEADTNHDGRLSFDEFRRWYTSSSTANIERLIENNIPEWLSLQEVRRLTNLGSYTPGEVFETFASFSANDGTLSKDAFRRAFAELKSGGNDQAADDRLRLMVDRIFALFDTDRNGVVDFSELASGLSVLCGGSETDKVRAAFNLYDVNHDGYISMGEMRLYLTSVFKVLFEVNPETEEQMGVTPDELGAITAEQAFAEADIDGDGRLSFDEFRNWYLQPGNAMNQSHVSEWVSLQVIKEMTHLERYAPNEVFEVFANSCSEDGTISRDAFENCFEQLIDVKFRNDEQHRARLRLILDRLFTVFDADGNGVVDFCELSSGLSVLCGGSREDKVRSAFALYDLNQDGFISLDEMVRYLTSVFKVLYEAKPETKGQLGVEPEELAVVTAEQCFLEADLNHDGRLSFEEFVRWYSRAPDFEAPAAGVASLDTATREQAARMASPSGNGKPSSAPQPIVEEGQEDDSFPTSKLYAASSTSGDAKLLETSSGFNMNSSSMERARRLLKLDTYEVNDIFEIFAEAAPSGELNFANFKKCFDQIIKLAGGHDTPEEKQEAEQMIRRLFRVFDSDKSNTVDFGELASGLSVLSGSSMDDKVRAAFQLYDINGDGFISLEEMISYMTSIFKVMYETSDNARTINAEVSPEELARTTATQCFKEADLNLDGKLSFEEFKKWCTTSA